MKKLLAFLAAAEAATGLALMIIPSLAGRVLFGAELSDAAIPLRILCRAHIRRLARPDAFDQAGA